MFALIRKEITTFFTSPIGYLVIGLFIVATGSFLWVFEGPFNIPNSGFASLTPFFELAPWIFILLIPAITMRSLADEEKAGTLELLLTKPITTWQLVFGKYLGVIFLILIALIGTLTYVWAIHDLGNPVGNLDVGATLGSYVGLLFLGATFAAMGIFTSSITSNQIVAFISAVCLCFMMYYGLEELANYNALGNLDEYLSQISIQLHYSSISRGLVDTRDLVYFLSIIGFFLFLTVKRLKKHR